MDVHLAVPAFQEGDDMLPTLRAINEQQVPETVDTLTQEVWVTLDPPDRELCTTWQAALRAEGFEPREAPSGKLSARNAAHDAGVEDGHDVLVTWDADAPPLRDDTLANLLAAFEDPAVVGARGHPVPPASPMGLFRTVQSVVIHNAFRNMHGQLSAFTAEGWQCAGPFDDSIDQTSIEPVWKEEEWGFARRLRSCGGVVWARDATVRDDIRRMMCRFDDALGAVRPAQNDWCGRRGEKTFQPRAHHPGCGCDHCDRP